MFTNNDYYNLDSAEAKVNQGRLVLDLRIKIDALEKVLVQRNVIGEGDVLACANFLKTTPEYKQLYDFLEAQEVGIKNYKNNPQQHLKDLFNAKMNGTIR